MTKTKVIRKKKKIKNIEENNINDDDDNDDDDDENSLKLLNKKVLKIQKNVQIILLHHLLKMRVTSLYQFINIC